MRHLFLALSLFLVGCASSYKVIRAPEAGVLGRFTSVQIQTMNTQNWLDNNTVVRDGPDYANWRSEIQIASTVIQQVATSHLGQRYNLVNKIAPETLTIDAELIAFNPGGRARYFGAGKGIIGVKVTLTNGRDGTTVGVAEVYGTVSAGSFREAYERCGVGIARFVLDHAR